MVDTMAPGLLPFRRITLAFLLLLLPTSAMAADNWIEVQSPHFKVQTNAGEKEARKVADQFEQIRNMFHMAFAALRVDPPQPIVIVAAKNENTLKLYLPEDWEVKGHLHHAGMYQPAQDKDYVILRLDTEGQNPFHTLYHEYTHALLRLNFSNLPLWFNEGLAEFFGNTTLGDKEIKTGTIDPGHLQLLIESKLIPIETLLEVDHRSPYYNETNRASVFYAESWAVVHFLMMDEDARKKELLKNFLAAWAKSGSQVDAARAAFGDLKQFGKRIEAYSRQGSFRIGIVKGGQGAAEKTYAARSVSAGEALATRGDFFSHHNRVEQAQPVLEEAVKAEPNLPFVHEALGYFHYRRHETEEADKEMVEAIKLGAAGFAPQYFHGFFLMQKGGYGGENAKEATGILEKAVQLNPEFAPAFEALSQAYAHSPETQKQAVNAGIKAVQLDPGQVVYSVNLAYLLLNNNRFSETRIMAQRIQAAATNAGEKQMAANMLQQVQQREEWAAKNTNAPWSAPAARVGPNTTLMTRPAEIARPETSADVPAQLKGREYGVDGAISAVECANKPEVMINLDLQSGPVSFYAPDFAKVKLSWEDGVPEPKLSSCESWKGRRVKMWFSPTSKKDYAGEISQIHFF